MIPTIKLNPKEYDKKYLPGSKRKTLTHTTSKETEIGGGRSDISSHSILNDVPTVATSYLIYDYEDLKIHLEDSTYPIPKKDKFKIFES